MNQTKMMGLRLPVQAAVNRTATGATLADSVGVEALQVVHDHRHPPVPPGMPPGMPPEMLDCMRSCSDCGWTDPVACIRCAGCMI